MDNRFLSRGKRVDNGEWIYWDIFGRVIEDICADEFVYLGSIQVYVINPATLGQCTGLEDKNGKLIFEGDIVRGTGVCGETVTESVRYSNGEYLPFDYLPASTVEIIATIHDTPGELGGENMGAENEN